MKTMKIKIFIFCLLALFFIGCSNKIEGQGNTIHNENNISPSVDNNTIKLSTGTVRFTETDRLVYHEYFKKD